MNSVLLASAKLLRASVAQLQRGLKVELPNGNHISPNYSICRNLARIAVVYGSFHKNYEINFQDLCIKWPKHSKYLAYPVPHPNKDAYLAYNDCSLWTGNYGSNRIELLDFIIAELTKIEYPNK